MKIGLYLLGMLYEVYESDAAAVRAKWELEEDGYDPSEIVLEEEEDF